MYETFGFSVQLVKFIKSSTRFCNSTGFKGKFAVRFRVFVILKFRCFLFLSYVCTSGSSMPLFSSLRSFETSNWSLSWINIGSCNMFNSRSRLLYSLSLFPVIHLTTFFETFPEFEFGFFLQSSSWNHTAVPAKLRIYIIPISRTCSLQMQHFA